MDILLIIAVGVMNICCLLFGVKVGQKTVKGEEVETPNLNPVKAVREAQEAARPHGERIFVPAEAKE